MVNHTATVWSRGRRSRRRAARTSLPTAVTSRPRDPFCRLRYSAGVNTFAAWAILLAGFFVIGLVVGLPQVLSGGNRRRRIERRLAQIDRRLQLVMDHLGVTEPEPIVAYLMAGEKIQAIKVYREQTGVSLAEAKGVVEDIARRHGIAAR